MNVKTNIGKKFLALVRKHFDNSSLKKIFNKNTVKVSYSCMPNMKNIINSHNKKMISTKYQTEERGKTCNCRQKNLCPLHGECLTEDIVYKATVQTQHERAEYIGIASGQFKTRYNNHTKSLKHQKYEKDTELSKYIWKKKTSNTDFNITWSIIKKSNTIMRKSGICNLCLDERIEILELKSKPNVITLNKRTELISKCRHQGHGIGKRGKEQTPPEERGAARNSE